jgi:hypothetical protein
MAHWIIPWQCWLLCRSRLRGATWPLIPPTVSGTFLDQCSGGYAYPLVNVYIAMENYQI